MDNQPIQEINRAQASRFALGQSPVAVQLTVHINNLLVQYGPMVTREFKGILDNPEMLDEARDSNFRINQLIEFYGFETMRKWFTDIYGWTYKGAA